MIEKNIPLLANLAYVAYNRGLPDDPIHDFVPIQNSDGTWTTHCNQAMQYILAGMGYDEMDGMDADEMVTFMSDPKNGWIEPAGDVVAQAHANDGVIVLSGWSNVAGHGHVNLILPGILEQSGTLGRKVPKVCNIGKDVFFGKRISYAYTMQEPFKYFALGLMVGQ